MAAPPRRTRVERGIYKRPGTTPAVYEITWTSEGRQCWRTIEGSLQDARAARGEVVGKLGKGERVGSSRVTLAEYSETWIATQEGRLRPGTLRTYKDTIRLHVLPVLGNRRVSSVTVDDIAGLIAGMQRKGFAAWTVRGTITVLGRLLGSAARTGLLSSNPVRQLERSERPKVERAEFPSLDRESVGRLIEATPDRYRVLVAVSVLLGLRQGEALGLRWTDVDTAAGVIRVRRQLDRRSGTLAEPKTRAARRDVPMPASLGRMLAGHRLASRYSAETDFVFASSVGNPLQVRNIVKFGLEPALAAAELPRLRWHDLRHVAATMMIEAGATPSYVARVLGHANPSITLSTYSHAFAKAEHDDRFRALQEQAFGDVLGGR